jgi:DNA primase
MQDPVQEIKAKLSIEDVVAPYVVLKKAGKYFKAPCPFHQEKTPSFFVSPDKQLAYCFSCQKGGDMFEFIQAIEGIDFKGALELLAEKAHVDLPAFSAQKPKISKDEKERLKSVNAGASKFFVQSLREEGAAAKVRHYLEQRGFTPATWQYFAVGFAPESTDALYRFLLDQKHEKQDVLASTVALSRDSESRKVVDRFQLRLMFPIDDPQGDIVAFGGRALRKGDQPKYLNSPEYVLYDKGSTLYNLGRAKKAIREADLAVVVEGYMDVMASHQAGVEAVVASCGTALGEAQFKLLKRYASRVALAFDSDKAGQDALLRAVFVAQTLDIQLFVVTIPGGKDAAEVVKENPELWVQAVENRQPYLDFFYSLWRGMHDLSTAAGKSEFTDALLDLLKGVQHPVERDHYVKLLSKDVGLPVDVLYDYLNQRSVVKGPRVKREALVPQVTLPKKVRLLKEFIALLLVSPGAFFELWEKYADPEVFLQDLLASDRFGPWSKILSQGFQDFYAQFETWLEQESTEDFPVGSVYKQVKAHYNQRAELNEAFYAGLPQADSFKKMTLQMEVRYPEIGEIQKEFTPLIGQLYLEFSA